MFANAFQSGFISIFYSVGSAPLSIWNKEVKNGHIRRVVDEEVKSLVLEIAGTNVATTYITCPQKPRVSLAIKLPFLVMIIKNMKKYFTFEIQILDDKDIRRRFRVSNFQSTTKVQPFCTTMPIGLSDGWNQVQFNLADFTKRAYGSTYLETVRVQVHANVRIRRIYFSDTLYSEDEMPNEFRLFLPTGASKAKAKEKVKVEKRRPSRDVAEEVPSGAPPSPVESPQAPKEEEKPSPAEVREEIIAPEDARAEKISQGERASIVDKTSMGERISIAPSDKSASIQEEAKEDELKSEHAPEEGEMAPVEGEGDASVEEKVEVTEGSVGEGSIAGPSMAEASTTEASPTDEVTPAEESAPDQSAKEEVTSRTVSQLSAAPSETTAKEEGSAEVPAEAEASTEEAAPTS